MYGVAGMPVSCWSAKTCGTGTLKRSISSDSRSDGLQKERYVVMKVLRNSLSVYLKTLVNHARKMRHKVELENDTHCG